MRCIIVGAGTIGGSIAEFLFKAGNDIIVIDRDRERLNRLEGTMDVQTVEGDGCDPAILGLAGIERAELLLAMTGDEHVNLLGAAAAKHLGAKQTVARARSAHYLRDEGFDFRKLLNIDLLLSPEVLTAAEVIKYLDNPNALALEFYAEGKVQLVQFEIEPKHSYAGEQIKDLGLPGGVLVVLVTRGKEVSIPTGNQELKSGDRITLMGKRGTIEGMNHVTGSGGGKLGSVVIAGGGTTGRLVAAGMEERAHHVKLLEVSASRCQHLGTVLEETTVLHGDATDRTVLHDERVGQADVFVAAMRSDEDNIMTALLARKLGAKKTVAIVKRPDYRPLLVENTDIDLALSPREVTATRVLALVKRGAVRNASLLEGGKVEIVELIAQNGAKLLNTPLVDVPFPRGECLVAMIRSGNNVRVPGGQDQIRAGDGVIMLMLSKVAPKVERLFTA